MGHSLSWLAVQDLDKATVYDRLGLVETDRSGDYTAFESSGRWLSGGVTLILLGQAEHPLVRRDFLAWMSADCRLIACSVEEHVMASSAEFWENGRRLWSVLHQGDEVVDHLDTEGNLPAAFDAIERHYRNLQAQEPAGPLSVDHIFEIPLMLARSLVPFKHDEADDAAFTELVARRMAEPRATGSVARRPWWRFGR
jgi:hypothetical protein